MSARQILPDSAYDFFVHDGRDGEEWGPYDTPEEALCQLRKMRLTVPSYIRPVFQKERRVNERKILALLAVKK